MNYKATDLCVCGHSFDDHSCNDDGICLECIFSHGIYGDGEEECESFRLDNLRYIEDEAKRQGLI
jgi:hypothetical protein